MTREKEKFVENLMRIFFQNLIISSISQDILNPYRDFNTTYNYKKRNMRLVVPLLSLFVAVQAKRTYRVEQTPVLKAPRVQKYDCRNCVFDDTLNYACLEHSIDVKVGWEIK